jgi:hypothetical protein
MSLPLYITGALPTSYRTPGGIGAKPCMFVFSRVCSCGSHPRSPWAGASLIWSHESLSSKTTKALTRALDLTNVVELSRSKPPGATPDIVGIWKAPASTPASEELTVPIVT